MDHGPTFMTSFNLNYLFTGPISKYSKIGGPTYEWGWGAQFSLQHHMRHPQNLSLPKPREVWPTSSSILPQECVGKGNRALLMGSRTHSEDNILDFISLSLYLSLGPT